MKEDKLKVSFFFLFSFFLYFNSLTIPFYFNDYHMVVANLWIKKFRYFLLFFGGHTTSVVGAGCMFRPLLMFSFALNYFLGGLNTLGYHLLNIIFHFFNATFLYFLLKHLKRDAPWGVIFIVTLLFISCPLNTEAVNYISARSDLMVTFFGGLAFFSFLRRKFFLSLIFYVASLFTKETGLCFPFLVLAYDFIFYQQGKKYVCDFEEAKKAKLFYILLFSITFLYFFLRGVLCSSFPPFFSRSSYSNFLIQSVNFFRYIRYFLFPYPLCFLHHTPEIDSIFYPSAFFSVIGLFTIIFFIFIFKKRRPLLCFGICWYMIGLLPLFYAHLYQTFAEYRFYFSSIGVYIVIFVLTERLYLKYKKYFLYISGGIILVFCILVWFRNWQWQDKSRLWQDTYYRNPFSWEVRYALAEQYWRKGNHKEAKKLLKKAISLADRRGKGRVRTRLFLATIYFQEKELPKVENLLKEAQAISPHYYKIYELWGKVYAQEGNEDLAIRMWEEGLKRFPYSWEIYDALAYFYFKKGNYQKVNLYAYRALKYYPEDFYAYFLLGKISKDLNSKIKMYKKSISFNPSFWPAHLGLAYAYVKKGELISAWKEIDKVVELNPQFLERSRKIKRAILRILKRNAKR